MFADISLLRLMMAFEAHREQMGGHLDRATIMTVRVILDVSCHNDSIQYAHQPADQLIGLRS